MEIGNKNMFPLSLLRSSTSLEGYYVDRDGVMYSTKQSAAGRRLIGSGFGSNKYYTMNGVSQHGSTLYVQAKHHPDWASHVAPKSEHAKSVSTVKAKSSGFAGRSHAKSVAEGLAAKGVMIGRVMKHNGEDVMVFGSNPAIHLTQSSYEDEMKRLALSYPGVKFVAVKVVKTAQAAGLVWE